MTHHLRTVPTPAAVIDLERLKQNTRKMAARAHRLGVQLRPHVKTHKCVEAAQLQAEGHFGGLAVSTLAEADFFGQRGFDDITFAVPLAPGRAPLAAQVAARLRQLNLVVDHPTAVDAIGEEARRRGQTLSLLIKVDCGYHRAGLLPDDPNLVRLAQQIHSHTHLNLLGVLAHGGHSYECVGVQAIRVVAEQERNMAVNAAAHLRNANLPCPTVSVGSTPTMAVVEDLTGITEIRPGNYALFDHFQADIGSCTPEDIALSVISEVIGVYPERSTLLLDAGALALSKDPGATHVGKTPGFGRLCTLDGHPLEGLTLTDLSQEHGKVKGSDVSRFTIGDRLRILPHHSCLVTALHETLYVEQEGAIVDTWQPVRGWSIDDKAPKR